MLSYLVSNKALTWTAAQVSTCLGAFDKTQLAGGVLDCFYIDRVADVTSTVTNENPDSRSSLTQPTVVVGRGLQSPRLDFCEELSIY